ELLPVGVVPVTAIISEIVYGPVERITVRYLDGSAKEITLGEIREYVAESTNAGNIKKVRTVWAELPAMARFQGVRFVDTPGLNSVLSHNTDVSRDWLPN